MASMACSQAIPVPTTTLETFPFPWPLNTPDTARTSEQRGHRDAIGEAARALDEVRRRWLNPPEWVREEPDVLPSLPARLLPVDEDAAKQLRKRTLTNLYNARPTWLANLHALSTPPSSPSMAGRKHLTMVHCWSGCSTSTSRGTEQASAATPNSSGTWRREARRGTFWAHRALCRRAPTRAREGARADAVAHSPCGEARAGTRSVGRTGAGAHSPCGEARRRGRHGGESARVARSLTGGAAPVGGPEALDRRRCTLPYGRRGAGWRPGGPWPAEVHAPLREAQNTASPAAARDSTNVLG